MLMSVTALAECRHELHGGSGAILGAGREGQINATLRQSCGLVGCGEGRASGAIVRPPGAARVQTPIGGIAEDLLGLHDGKVEGTA